MTLKVNDNTKLLLHKKHLLETKINKLLTEFHTDTDLWVTTIQIFKETSKSFETLEGIVVEHYVKVTVPLEV